MQVLIATSGLLPPSDSFAASSLSCRVVISSLRRSGFRYHEPPTFRGGAGVARLTCRKQAAPGGASLQPRDQPRCLALLLKGHEGAGCSSPWGLTRSWEGWIHLGMLPWGDAPPNPWEQDPLSCRLPRDTAPVARGQPGCACSTASLPRSPLVSPSLSSLQSNLLNSPCPRARSVHFHDVSSVCPRAAHKGQSPSETLRRGQLPLRQESGGSSPHLRFSAMPELACRTEG